MADAKKPVIICGCGDNRVMVSPRPAKLALKLACLLTGPNSFGAALLAAEHGATSLAKAIADRQSERRL